MSKPTKERVRELLNAGVKPKVIAQKLGIKPATVYTYRHIFKKEEEKKMSPQNTKESSAKVNEIEKDWKQLYENMKEKYEKLQEEHSSLKKRNEELINEARSELETYEKLYKSEKEKHETLLSYIFLEKKASTGLVFFADDDNWTKAIDDCGKQDCERG